MQFVLGARASRSVSPLFSASGRKQFHWIKRLLDPILGFMSGINFLVDEHGQKTAVMIDLKRHGRVWEDFYDTLLVASRKDEPRETLDEVRRRLKLRKPIHG